jgi:hypothetical protein
VVEVAGVLRADRSESDVNSGVPFLEWSASCRAPSLALSSAAHLRRDTRAPPAAFMDALPAAGEMLGRGAKLVGVRD